MCCGAEWGEVVTRRLLLLVTKYSRQLNQLHVQIEGTSEDWLLPAAFL